MKKTQISASTSSLAGYSLQDATETIRRLGFASIGVLGQVNSRNAQGQLPGYSWHYLEANGMNAVRDAVSGFEVVTIHAPYTDLQLASCSPDVRSLSQIIVQKGTEAAPYLHAANVTFHLEPPRYFDCASAWDLLVAAGREIARYAKIFAIKVAVETSPLVPTEVLVRLLDEIAAPNLGATLDVGAVARCAAAERTPAPHAIEQVHQAIVRSVGQLGVRLYHVHLHDVAPDGWRDHRAIGAGILDFGRIIGALDAAGYAGALELELEEEEREEALWNSRLALERYVTD